MRVAAVQYQMRAVETLTEFEKNVEYFVDVCADYRADFCLFPEMFTVALLALEKRRLSPEESIAALSKHTPRFIEFMSQLAVRYLPEDLDSAGHAARMVWRNPSWEEGASGPSRCERCTGR